MCRYYYRVTVNGQRAVPTTEYPGGAQWARIAQTCEDRGWTAMIERQLLIENGAADFMAGIVDATGYLRMKDRVASPWEVLAEMKPNTVLIIGGDNDY